MIYQTPATSDPATWGVLPYAIITIFLGFLFSPWGRKTVDWLSEKITDRANTRKEMIALADKIGAILTRQENTVKEMQTLTTSQQVLIERINANRETLDREQEDIQVMQKELKDLQKEVSEIKGRLQK